jgi:hypothetical protein
VMSGKGKTFVSYEKSGRYEIRLINAPGRSLRSGFFFRFSGWLGAEKKKRQLRGKKKRLAGIEGEFKTVAVPISSYFLW